MTELSACIYIDRLAGSQAGAYSFVSEFHTNKLAPRAVAFCMICLNGLIIFTSIAAIAIIPLEFEWKIFFIVFKSWRLYLICNSFINLFNGIVFTILPESPKFLLTIGQKEKALEVLKYVYAFNTGQSKEVRIYLKFSRFKVNKKRKIHKYNSLFTELSREKYQNGRLCLYQIKNKRIL